MGWLVFFLTLCGHLLVSVLSLTLVWSFGLNLSDYPFCEPLLYLLIFFPPLLYARKRLCGIFSCKRDGNNGFEHLGTQLRVVAKPYVFALLPILFLSVAVLVSTIPFLEPPLWYVDKMARMLSPERILWSVLTVSVLAPVLEEIIFRRVIEGEFLKSYSPVVAIILSSLLFGLIHQNLWQMIPAFFYGVLFGWVYYKFRNVWITIGLHSLNNTITIVMAYLFRDNLTMALAPLYEIVENDLIFYPLIIGAIVIFVFSIYHIYKGVSWVKVHNSNEQ